MAWAVGIEFPEDLALAEVEVEEGERESGKETPPGLPSDELRRPLVRPLGSCRVRWREVESIVRCERLFEAAPCRLFKLTTAGDFGRGVRRLTRGHYLVVAPRSWDRQGAGGAEPISPESVVPESARLLAHHVLAREDEARAAFTEAGEVREDVRPAAAEGARLTGHHIPDAHETAGPLFGRDPPDLRTDPSATPEEVVVGFEGPMPRRRGRRSARSYDSLRAWIERHEPGWFFVRLYDQNANLMDSFDFRYAKALHAIALDACSPLPGSEGHVEVRARFRLDQGPRLVIAGDGPGPAIMQAGPDGEACYAVPVDQDRVALELRGTASGSVVPIHLAVPRVWWSFRTDPGRDPPDPWGDGPAVLNGDQFRATAPDCLALRLPWAGWADKVRVGWRGRSPRERLVIRNDQVVVIPLRDLGDELSGLRADAPASLELSVRAGGVWHGPVRVGTVPPRALPAPTTTTRALRISVLSAPRLMGALSRVARSGGVRRSAVRRLRRSHYQPRAIEGAAHADFIRQGLALLHAIADGNSPPPIPARWARRASLMAAQDPVAVAEWRRWMRMTAGAGASRAQPGGPTGKGVRG